MPSEKKYYYETPMWAVVILCSVAALVAITCFMAFYYWVEWADEEPIAIKWLLLIIGLGFLIVAIRPGNWQPWRYFYADSAGIHFPSECPQTKNTTWLLVPWNHVGNIRREVFLGRSKGPSIELQLQDDEIDRFFHNDKLAKKFFGREVRKNGFFKVGYSNAFKSIDDTVRILNEFKGRST